MIRGGKCDTIIKIFDDAAKVSVLSEDICEECETVKMKVSDGSESFSRNISFFRLSTRKARASYPKRG